jgi:hypothetical protein
MPATKSQLLKGRANTRTAAKYNATNPIDPIIGMYKQSLILSELKRYRGKLTSVATALNITLGTMQKYIKQSKVLQECLVAFNEAELDKAEEKLVEQIDKGNLAAIQFMLKCKGKERGWTEKSELSIEMAKPITFKYTVVKPKEEKK